MKSMIGAFDKLGMTPEGGLAGDIASFTEKAADEKCARLSTMASPGRRRALARAHVLGC